MLQQASEEEVNKYLGDGSNNRSDSQIQTNHLDQKPAISNIQSSSRCAPSIQINEQNIVIFVQIPKRSYCLGFGTA